MPKIPGSDVYKAEAGYLRKGFHHKVPGKLYLVVKDIEASLG